MALVPLRRRLGHQTRSRSVSIVVNMKGAQNEYSFVQEQVLQRPGQTEKGLLRDDQEDGRVCLGRAMAQV